MVTTTIENNAMMFLSELESLAFSNVYQYFDFKVSLTIGEILSETYYPNELGFVEIKGLNSLLLPYISMPDLNALYDLSKYEPLSVQIQCTDQSGTTQFQIYVYYNMLTSNHKVSEGLILSRYQEVVTAPGREEFFSFIAGKTTVLSIEAAYWDGDNARYKTKTNTIAVQDVCNYTHVRASVSHIAEELIIPAESILYYDISVKNDEGSEDKIRYKIDRYRKRSQTTFLYHNTFGMPETITFVGLQRYEPEFNNNLVSMLYNEKQVDADFKDIRTVYSGYMLPEKYDSLIDMLSSSDVRLLEDGQNVPIVFTDIDFSHRRIGNERINVSLTFRPSIRQSGRFIRPDTLKSRVFDKTFDYTFD